MFSELVPVAGLNYDSLQTLFGFGVGRLYWFRSELKGVGMFKPWRVAKVSAVQLGMFDEVGTQFPVQPGLGRCWPAPESMQLGLASQARNIV